MHQLRDPEIRRPLHQWLSEKMSDHSDTEILHELRMLRPSARVDVAVINGRLSGYEIKSDVDSLWRLPRQVRACNAVFDEMCVVTTSRHLSAVKDIIPSWWRLSVQCRRNGKWIFRTYQKGARNPGVRADALLHMLNRSELVDIARARSFAFGAGALRRNEIVVALLERLTLNDVRTEVRRLLKQRALKAATRTANNR